MEAVNILIAFYSRDGSVEALANAAAEGANAEGADVRLRRVREIVPPETMARVAGWADRSARMSAAYPAPTEEDAEWADGILFGTPTRFGNASAELKAFIDSLGGLWFQGKLNNKAAGAFVSTNSPHGGNESTIVSLYNPLAHLGFVIVPLGYLNPLVFQAGTPYGASHVAGPANNPLSAESAEVARFQGRRLSQVARLLKPLRASQPVA